MTLSTRIGMLYTGTLVRVGVGVQIRLDMLYSHYYTLRQRFEVFESARGDNLVRTRWWVLEVMRMVFSPSPGKFRVIQ